MFTILPASAGEIDVLRAIDDDASALYAAHGIPITLLPEHPFSRAELARWRRSAELGRAFVARDPSGNSLGFAALELVDGEPYLDQLSVRVSAMRRGIGGRLLAHSAAWARAAGGGALWLTTYDHLPFNRPYYEQRGYVVVPDSACSVGIRHQLDEQRCYLPAPGQRVAMRRLLRNDEAPKSA
ncbi:MAG TPA: GNAT family N-acetyltransferase [Polyangiaceae bacterium]|jgi:GNAT superfamily N-acetyltransferase